MHTWPTQDAKAQWHRLQIAARPSLKQLLLMDEFRVDLNVPARGQAHRKFSDLSATDAQNVRNIPLN